MSEEQKLAGGFAFLHGVSWLTGIALGAFTTTSSAEDGRWASQNPSPAGREMLSAMTHPCAAFRGRGSSFCEWESLCYFLFTGFSHRLFPPGGTAVLKNKVQSFCGWNIFFFFFFFFNLKIEILVFSGENGKCRSEGRKKKYFRQGWAMHRMLFFYILLQIVQCLLALKDSNVSTGGIWGKGKVKDLLLLDLQ